jgi:hypothetical protein
MNSRNEIIQYILKSQSFNESDIAFIMYSMFKDIYKTDFKGQWYSLKSDGSWILMDIFDIRDLIGSSVCNTIVNCVNRIKEHPDLYKPDGHNTFDFNGFDPMTIVRSLHTKAFIDHVMEQVSALFLRAD